MILTIHQPEHLPWLGFFNKISKAEAFVILDNVQFRKNYFQNRNRILGSNGVQYIGVPTRIKGHMDNDLSHTEISEDGSNAKWREKYIKTIQMSYGRHPFYHDVFPLLEEAIYTETHYLCDINIAIIKGFADRLGVHPDYIRASEMELDGSKSDLILHICEKLNADVYIAGPGGRDYLNMESFSKAGITVRYNDYLHPVYPQRKAKEFESNLAALDLFMNCGWEEGKMILMAGNEGLSEE